MTEKLAQEIDINLLKEIVEEINQVAPDNIYYMNEVDYFDMVDHFLKCNLFSMIWLKNILCMI